MRTIFKDARIFTGLEDGDAYGKHTCMVINDDLIEHVGNDTDEAVQTATKEGAKVVNLSQQTLSPGFMDGHMHLLGFGSSLEKVSIEHCKNLPEIQDTIRTAAKADQSIPRILCCNWMHFMTGSKALASDLEGLDELNRPIYVESKDLHSSWCNQAALDEMGVANMPDPPGGSIERDENEKPTGLMSEAAAIMFVWPFLAKAASKEQKRSFIRGAIKAYQRTGYTGLIEMAMDENGLEALLEYREKEGLSIRFSMYWIISPAETDEELLRQVDRAVELSKKYNLQTSPDLRVVGVKVIGDGVVDACTAALLEPYSSNGVSVEPLWKAEALKKVVERADTAGLQVALHAIGDATVKLAIDTLEAVPSRGQRARIEHLEMTSPGDAKRMSEAGITASVQAVHCDPAILREWTSLLGEERRKRAFAYREFLDEGVKLALGTDAPTAPEDALANLYTATTRRSAREPDYEETVNKNFALPILNAFSAATQGAAYSVFLDKLTGKLEAGLKADFVVLDMEWAPEKLLQGRVSQTWFNGKQVYTRDK